MSTKLFFEAMNKVSDQYYEEAANYQHKRRGWVKLTSLAACLVVVLAALSASLWQPFLEQTPQRETVTRLEYGADGTEQVISVNINEIDAPDAVMNNINLIGEDYTSMTYEELLTYFGVSLPITETLPYLNPVFRNDGFGIYQSENRSVYFDGNTVVFESADGTQRMTIGLAKVFKHMYDLFGLTGEKIEFTDINGRELTVFHYTNGDGTDCYYTEFLQDDVAFRIDSENIPVEEHVKCLQALVKKMPYSAETNYKIKGHITAIDPYANHIGILLDDDVAPRYSRGYGIELPNDRSADDYSLGDLVEVTFTGEPATICTIWAEQFVDISLVS